jgi:hypothetical protein
MCASPFDMLRAGPPPPRVVIVPDSVFFSRSIPVPAGASGDDVISQVGLALEALSPFPLSQLYYGYFRPAEATRALAFAAYRRRFTADQLAEWAGAEHVMPAFAAILGCDPGAGTTVILSAADGLTAVHWDEGPVPSAVLYLPLAPEATDDVRAQTRAKLIASTGGAKRLLELPSPPAAQPGRTDTEIVFEAGGVVSRLPSGVAAALDIRDRADLDALARARRRDLILWRTTVGALAACAILALGELSLVGAGLWQSARVAKVAAQRATVDRVMEEQDLARHIDDLSTKRLLPLEMISTVSPEVALPKNPTSIQFLRAQTSGLYTIVIDAQTTNAGEIAGYKTALEQTPACDHVEIKDQRARDNVVSFTIVVTFKPAVLTPATT